MSANPVDKSVGKRWKESAKGRLVWPVAIDKISWANVVSPRLQMSASASSVKLR
jgi:hypothetical protein